MTGPSLLIGAIADDFTGASDLANTLARGGMRTVQTVGIPASFDQPVDAVVIALKTRSVPAEEAVAQSLAAHAWLKARGACQILFKYCSTFDSTPKGNIGPVADALLEATGADCAVVCPTFPKAGRTVYMGHLFVGDRLLSESGMERHPLTPMTDPDLRRWLSRQSRNRVGLVTAPTVRQGAAVIAAALAQEADAGHRLAVVDAVSDEDLRAIGHALAEAPLVTGGSGIALGLADNFRSAGRVSGEREAFLTIKGPVVVISGSCSSASLDQVARFAAEHPAIRVEAADVMEGRIDADTLTADVLTRLGATPIIYSTADPEQVAAAQAQFGREALAQCLEETFGRLARNLAQAGVRRLVIGGGETSGAVVQALGIDAFRIGEEIDPGVPALHASRDSEGFGLVLKSGNFGEPDFFKKAVAVLAGEEAQ